MTATSETPFDIRGLMVDPARLTERHEFYFDLLKRLAAWGFNTLWWHFSDDEGFALELDAHPELAGPNALSKSRTRELVRRGRELGVTVVPEVESLGHARYVTRLPQYAHLADGDPARFNAMCPSQPETTELLGEIIAEVADVFDTSPYLHAGLDEVNLGDCPRCAERGAGKDEWWVYAEHACAVHEIVSKAGKRMIMWADHVEKTPAMRDRLPTDVILAHWHYFEPRREQIAASLDAGFEVICVPAMLHAGNVVHPDEQNLDNTDAVTEAAASLAGRGVLGVVNSWWTAWRIPRDVQIPTIAYTGRVLDRGGGVDRQDFLKDFVREHFGVDDTRVADAIGRLHQLALHRAELQALLSDSLTDVIEAVELAGREDFDARAEAVGECAAVLTEGLAGVTANAHDYGAWVLASRIDAVALDNGRRLRQAVAACRSAEWRYDCGVERDKVAEPLDEAADLLRRIAEDGDELTRLAAHEWDRTRYADDPKKHVADADDAPCGPDVLLGRLARSREFFERLQRTFARGVTGFRDGGRLPAAGIWTCGVRAKRPADIFPGRTALT